MTKLDLYAVLGLEKTASEDEIKRGYRRQSLRWHPDKNPDNAEAASAKFKDISEAYQILSDEKKRKAYDAGHDPTTINTPCSPKGTPQRGGGASFHFTDPADVFKNFFGGRNPFSMFDDNDFFGGGFGGSFGSFASFGRQGSTTSTLGPRTRSGAHFGGRQGSSLFDDAFFGSQSGSAFGDGFFGSFSSPTNKGGSTMRMTSSTTRILNGKRVTTKVTKTVHADGREETREETFEDKKPHNTSTITHARPGSSSGAKAQQIPITDLPPQAQAPRSPTNVRASGVGGDDAGVGGGGDEQPRQAPSKVRTFETHFVHPQGPSLSQVGGERTLGAQHGGHAAHVHRPLAQQASPPIPHSPSHWRSRTEQPSSSSGSHHQWQSSSQGVGRTSAYGGTRVREHTAHPPNAAPRIHIPEHSTVYVHSPVGSPVAAHRTTTRVLA